MSCCVSLVLSDNIKQYVATKSAHRKRIIDLLKNSKCLGAGHSTIWESIDSFTKHYKCDTTLFLLSILPQYFNITIDHGISAPGHGREVVDGLNYP